MNTAETKTPAAAAKAATTAKKSGPFFGKRKGGNFFPSGRKDGSFFPGSTATGGVVQSKLTVGQPNDVYEKEADSMADKVVQRLSEPGGGMVQTCAAYGQEEKIHKKADSGPGQNAPTGIESSLHSSKGSGSPMTGNTQREMEDSFGVDLGHVRIHRDSSAAKMSKDLNAQAFTHGSDIYFNSSKYDEGSKTGK